MIFKRFFFGGKNYDSLSYILAGFAMILFKLFFGWIYYDSLKIIFWRKFQFYDSHNGSFFWRDLLWFSKGSFFGGVYYDSLINYFFWREFLFYDYLFFKLGGILLNFFWAR